MEKWLIPGERQGQDEARTNFVPESKVVFKEQ